MLLDTGYHLISVIPDGEDCPVAIYGVTVNCDSTVSCPDLYTGVDLVFIEDCDSLASICTDIPVDEAFDYTIFDNGALYNNGLLGCNSDTLVSYSYFTLVIQHPDGPYDLNNWEVNSSGYNGGFGDIPALVDSMNTWDPAGNWTLNETSFTISGGNQANSYGEMVVFVNGDTAAIFQPNIQVIPNTVSISLDTGFHQIILINNITACTDSFSLTVSCEPVQPPVLTVDTVHLFTYVDSMFTYCIDTTELIGNFVSIENICEPNSVDFVNFIVGDSICITILADAIGIDTACIVICDDLGNCDTTIIIVTVLPDSVQLIPPIAVDDAATTVINSSVVIEVLENDTLNGTLTSIVILEDPEYGTATVTADNNIEYAPFQDVCDVIDSFTYVIGNGIGFDTATVTVEILCDSITIFSGFSPNNDGVNDVFTILGLDNFPDNTLLIFNRWGNQVFETMNYQNNWDGKWDGKDLPDGTYFYVLDLGNGEKLSGYVQIHR
jgi:gliding motility-associated-like protein